MAMEVVFITTTKDKLDTVPVINGQVLALSDADGYFYDHGDKRHSVSGHTIAATLPAVGIAGQTYIITEGTSEYPKGLYVWNTSTSNWIDVLRLDKTLLWMHLDDANWQESGISSPSGVSRRELCTVSRRFDGSEFSQCDDGIVILQTSNGKVLFGAWNGTTLTVPPIIEECTFLETGVDIKILLARVVTFDVSYGMMILGLERIYVNNEKTAQAIVDSKKWTALGDKTIIASVAANTAKINSISPVTHTVELKSNNITIRQIYKGLPLLIEFDVASMTNMDSAHWETEGCHHLCMPDVNLDEIVSEIGTNAYSMYTQGTLTDHAFDYTTIAPKGTGTVLYTLERESSALFSAKTNNPAGKLTFNTAVEGTVTCHWESDDAQIIRAEENIVSTDASVDEVVGDTLLLTGIFDKVNYNKMIGRESLGMIFSIGGESYSLIKIEEGAEGNLIQFEHDHILLELEYKETTLGQYSDVYIAKYDTRTHVHVDLDITYGDVVTSSNSAWHRVNCEWGEGTDPAVIVPEILQAATDNRYPKVVTVGNLPGITLSVDPDTSKLSCSVNSVTGGQVIRRESTPEDTPVPVNDSDVVNICLIGVTDSHVITYVVESDGTISVNYDSAEAIAKNSNFPQLPDFDEDDITNEQRLENQQNAIARLHNATDASNENRKQIFQGNRYIWMLTGIEYLDDGQRYTFVTDNRTCTVLTDSEANAISVEVSAHTLHVDMYIEVVQDEDNPNSFKLSDDGDLAKFNELAYGRYDTANFDSLEVCKYFLPIAQFSDVERTVDMLRISGFAGDSSLMQMTFTLDESNRTVRDVSIHKYDLLTTENLPEAESDVLIVNLTFTEAAMESLNSNYGIATSEIKFEPEDYTLDIPIDVIKDAVSKKQVLVRFNYAQIRKIVVNSALTDNGRPWFNGVQVPLTNESLCLEYSYQFNSRENVGIQGALGYSISFFGFKPARNEALQLDLELTLDYVDVATAPGDDYLEDGYSVSGPGVKVRLPEGWPFIYTYAELEQAQLPYNTSIRIPMDSSYQYLFNTENDVILRMTDKYIIGTGGVGYIFSGTFLTTQGGKQEVSLVLNRDASAKSEDATFTSRRVKTPSTGSSMLTLSDTATGEEYTLTITNGQLYLTPLS